jgi:pyridoxal 5'-phosphate synthase pdxT subunit
VKVGVLGLQGDVREHARAIETSGGTPVVVKRAHELQSVDALIIPGGESTTIGKLLDRFDLLDGLVQRVDSGMPLYGTCAGLILMARSISGEQDAPHRLNVMDVAVRRNAYGRQVDSFETDLSMPGIDDFRAVFIRAPIIEDVGADVDVLAVHDDHPVIVRQGRLLASSFHPEMTGDTRVHAFFLNEVCH